MTQSSTPSSGRPGCSLFLAAIGLFATCCMSAADELPRPLPAFTHADQRDWINSRPLSVEELSGQVLLIDFWTFDCWNCYRSFPWLISLEERLTDRPFLVLGVHTPEFEHERDRARIKEKTEAFGLRHAVMIDNDFSYWNAMGTRYWPTYYLVDKRGSVRSMFIGETHAGSSQARSIEQMVETLLAEEP